MITTNNNSLQKATKCVRLHKLLTNFILKLRLLKCLNNKLNKAELTQIKN